MKTNRPAAEGDQTVIVEGIGRFVFGRRSLRSQLLIEAEFGRLTEGVIDYSSYFGEVCTALADIAVLAVEVPDDWEPLDADALEEKAYERPMRVWKDLRLAEARFRGRVPADQAGEGKGEGS